MALMRFLPVLLSVTALLLSSPPAAAQVVTYDFTGAPGDQASTTGAVGIAGVTAGAISRGAGVTTAGGTNTISAANWAANQADALAQNDYFTFTVTAPAGQFFTFTTLDFNAQRRTEGPNTLEIRTSLDNFAAPVATFASLPVGTTPLSANLAGLNALPAADTPIEFRFYAYGTADSASFLRLANINSPDGTTPGVTLNGTISPVPEPGSVLAISALLFSLGRFYRRGL